MQAVRAAPIAAGAPFGEDGVGVSRHLDIGGVAGEPDAEADVGAAEHE
jgi:hypothetical protein